MSKLSAARYGKDKVRLFRVVRDGPMQQVAEYTVCALLEGDIETSFTQADNSVVVATDSIKNTIYIKAKESPHVLQAETFALELGIHFVSTYNHIHKAFIDVIQHKWTRMNVDGQAHPHAFIRDGEEVRTIAVEVDASSGKNNITARVQSGLKDLLVLKSSGSAFENFVRDEYTTLSDVSDRIFSTAVDCTYSIALPEQPLTADGLLHLNVPFAAIADSVKQITCNTFATDQSASVQATMYLMAQEIINANPNVLDVSYRLPNKHYWAVDLGFWKNTKNLLVGDAEVYTPVSHPSGLITCTVTRT